MSEVKPIFNPFSEVNTYYTGELKLVAGDTIFARNLQGSQEAKDDDIQVWITGK
jgi:hypothetical protein